MACAATPKTDKSAYVGDGESRLKAFVEEAWEPQAAATLNNDLCFGGQSWANVMCTEQLHVDTIQQGNSTFH